MHIPHLAFLAGQGEVERHIIFPKVGASGLHFLSTMLKGENNERRGKLKHRQERDDNEIKEFFCGGMKGQGNPQQGSYQGDDEIGKMWEILAGTVYMSQMRIIEALQCRKDEADELILVEITVQLPIFPFLPFLLFIKRIKTILWGGVREQEVL